MNTSRVIPSTNRPSRTFLAIVVLCGLAVSSRATVLVSDTWLDGDRNDPTSAGTPAYAENNGATSADSDSDGNLESAWFKGGGGTLEVSNTVSGALNTAAASGNVLNGVTSGSSQHWYTYFTQPSTKVTLANPGDELKLTWVFRPTTIGVNTSQALPIALVNNPSARVTSNGTLPTGIFSGYEMFLNFSTTLGASAPFALKEWITTSAASAFGASSAWGADGAAGTLANGAVSGNPGYTSGTEYTFVFGLQLDPGGSGNLIISSSMTGGTLNGSGVASLVYTDSTPNGLSYDLFGMRPANAASTAASFDTSLFQVEFNSVPEPSTFALAAAGLGLMMAMIRRRR